MRLGSKEPAPDKALLGVNGISVPSEIHFLHRYFCSKTELGTRDVQLVSKTPFKLGLAETTLKC